MSINQKGKKHWNWKGGRIVGKYIRIYMPLHPYNYKGYVPEHRLVMEKHIDRYLKPKEIVHHINEITTDNRIENLKLFKGVGEHIRNHLSKTKDITSIELKKLYKTYTQKEIGEKFGCCANAIRGLFKRFKMKAKKANYKYSIKKHSVKTFYNKVNSLRKTAKEFNCGVTTIKRRLVELN